MKLHLRATGCHLPYGITQCYLPPNTSEQNSLTDTAIDKFATKTNTTDTRARNLYKKPSQVDLHKEHTRLTKDGVHFFTNYFSAHSKRKKWFYCSV